MTETWFLAALWLGLALIATLVSIWQPGKASIFALRCEVQCLHVQKSQMRLDLHQLVSYDAQREDDRHLQTCGGCLGYRDYLWLNGLRTSLQAIAASEF